MAKFDDTTISDLIDRGIAAFLAKTSSGDAVLRRSVENVLVYVEAGMTYGLYGAINYVGKQIVPSEEMALQYLLRWSNAFLSPPQKAASAATGDATFAGTPTTVIPPGTSVSNRDGASFTTDAELTIAAGGSITGAVTASIPGASGNTLTGAALFLSTPIPGIDSQATVASGGLGGGADEEDSLGVLRRLLARWKTPPRGGGTGDFATWALEVPGVTRAFEFRQEPGTGYVTVVIVDDDTGPVPSAQTVIDAQANIDSKRPIMMGGAPVLPPVGKLLTLTWTALVPDTSGTRMALESNVNEWVLQNGEPELILRQPDIENAAQATPGVVSVSLSSPVIDQDPGQYGMFTTFSHLYS